MLIRYLYSYLPRCAYTLQSPAIYADVLTDDAERWVGAVPGLWVYYLPLPYLAGAK